jgi:predicted PurR-regulated permease PerM
MSFILILVISFYVSFFKNIPENILLFFNVENKYLKIVHFLRRKIAFWFVGLIFLMIFIGISTYIFTAFILKLKYALVISLAAGIFEALPILGPIITLVLALFVVFLENPSYILPTIIFFISIQQLENHLLVPLVMRKALSLNPILIILGILIGAKIAGVLGIIIITPILGSIVETIKLLKTDKKI